VPVQVTDYLVQGVAVPAGSHVVELRYRDPWLGVGVIASATAWALLGGLFLVLRRRERMLGPPVARQGHDAVGLGSAGVAATGPEETVPGEGRRSSRHRLGWGGRRRPARPGLGRDRCSAPGGRR